MTTLHIFISHFSFHRYADLVFVNYHVLVEENGQMVPSKVASTENYSMQGDI